MEGSSLGKEVSCPSDLSMSCAPLLPPTECKRPNGQEGTISNLPVCNVSNLHSKGQAGGEYQYDGQNLTGYGSDEGGKDQTQSDKPASNASVCLTEVCDLQKTTLLSDEQTQICFARLRGNQQDTPCDTEKTSKIMAETDRVNFINVCRVVTEEMSIREMRDPPPKETIQISLGEVGEETVEQVLTPKSRKTRDIADANDDLSECMPVILNVRGNAVDITDDIDQINNGENVESEISTSEKSVPSQPLGYLEKTHDNLNAETATLTQKDCITTTTSNTPASILCVPTREDTHVSSVSLNALSEMLFNKSTTQRNSSSVSNSSRKKHSLPPSIYMNKISGNQGSVSHVKILSNGCDQIALNEKDSKRKESVKVVKPKTMLSLLKPVRSPPHGPSQTTSTVTSLSTHRISSSSNQSSGPLNSESLNSDSLSSVCLSSGILNSDNCKLNNLDSANPRMGHKVLDEPTDVAPTVLVSTTSAAGKNDISDDAQEGLSSTPNDRLESESTLHSFDLLPEFRGMNRQEILASGLLRVTKKPRTDFSKQHVCFVCGDEFYTEEFLQFHLKRNVFVLTYFCRICHKLFTFHNKCAFVHHVLGEAIRRENLPLRTETSFMKLEPYLPSDAKKKPLECESQSSQSVVLSDHQSATVVPCDQSVSTIVVSGDLSVSTIVPGDQSVSTVVPGGQSVPTTYVSSDQSKSTTLVADDHSVSTTVVPGDQTVSITVVPGDQRVSTAVVPGNQRLSTAVVPGDQRVSTTVVHSDQRTSTTIVYNDQRPSTTVVTSDHWTSTNLSTSSVPSNRKIVTSVVPSNYQPSKSVVSNDNHRSVTVVLSGHRLSTVILSDHLLSTSVVPSIQKLSTTVVPSDQRLSKTVVSCDQRLSTRIVPNDPKLSTKVLSSNQIPSTTVIPSDQGLSTTVVPTDPSDQTPTTAVIPSDQAPSPTVVQSQKRQSKKSKCPFCRTTFYDSSCLTSHFQRVTSQTYTCHICRMELFNLCSFSAHRGIHGVEEEKDLVTCPECGETLPLQYSQDFRLLFEHLDSCSHFSAWYTVGCVCGKNLNSFAALKEHFLKEHLQVRFQCQKCQAVRPSMYLMFLHYRNKHQDIMCTASVTVQCLLCKKLFTNPTALRIHVDKEISICKQKKQKVYQCIICLGSFASASDLNAHLERFHVYKPKRCTLCCGLFMARKNLVNHLVSKSCPKKFPKLLHLCLDSPSERETPFNNKLFAKLFEVKSMDINPTAVVSSVQQNVITALTDNDTQNEATASVTVCSLTQSQQEKNSENRQLRPSHESISSDISSDRRSSTSKQMASDNHKHQCHKCRICLVGSINFKKHMTYHKVNDSQSGLSQCVVCNKMVAEISILSHMEEHQNDGEIVCTLCHRRDFPNLDLAQDHSKNWCYYKEVDGWGEDFLKENSNPSSHANTDRMDHGPSKSDSVSKSRDLIDSNFRDNKCLVFPCLMCGLAFSTKTAKDDHVSRIHDGTKTFFLCLVCKKRGIRKAFNKKQKASAHISRKHRILDSTAISKLILEEEQNISSGQVILSNASSQESLDEPPPKRLRQEAEGAFLCGKCGFSNGQMEIFEQHIKSHNPKGEPQCPECGLCFTVIAALKKHLFAVHRIKDVKEYMKSKGIEEIIEYISSDDDDEDDMQVDVISSGSLPDECEKHPLKSRESTNKQSIKKAKIDSPWECNVCYKTFTCELVLKSHMRSHGMAFIRSRRDRNKDLNSIPQSGST